VTRMAGNPGRVFASATCLLLALIQTGWARNAESTRFAEYLDSVYAGAVQRSPMLATEYGERAGDDRWDDLSAAGVAADAAAVRRRLEVVGRQFAYAKLDEPARLQYRVFVDEQRLLLDRFKWRDHFYALNQIVGLHVSVPEILITQQRLDTVGDAHHYIQRIAAVDRLFGQLVAQMKAQARKGIYMPVTVYPLLIEGARNVITGAPFDGAADSPIYADFKRRVELLGASQAQKEALLADCRTALQTHLKPGYEGLIALLQLQATKTPVEAGVWRLPEGDKFYAFLVKQFTTTRMTPAEIHALGLQQVERVHGQIAAVMKALGITGSVRDFMNATKSEPRFYVPNTDAGREELLSRARTIVTGIQARITEVFPGPAPLALEVRRTEAYKEASSPGGFYEPGSADGRRPGIIYLNLADTRQQPLYELEDLLYHEGIPGHHLQISTILMNPSVPKLRKVNEWWQDTAFVEGWGLYAERLAKDMGFYKDPYSDLGRLTGELWRACRLVVDSGLHYKRWSRAEAIRYLQENSAAPDGTIVREVDRYIAVPGQATAFTVGMLKFVSERERARRELGADFNLAEYHRVVLENGYLPLWAVESRVSQWIRERRAMLPAEEFHALLDRFWAGYLRLNPALALSVGDYSSEESFDDSLEDSWRTKMLALLDQTDREMRDVSSSALTGEDRTSYALLRYRLDSLRHFYGTRLFELARQLPVDQFQGLHVAYALDAAGAGAYPFKTTADYDRALIRADNYSRWTDDAIHRLRQGVIEGVVLPRVVVERMLPQLHAHLGIPAEQTQFWKPIQSFPEGVTAQDRQRFTDAFRIKISTVIQPAYQRLYDYLRTEYLLHARQSVGLGGMKEGAALYRYDVEFHTTTHMSAEQIHKLGEQEVRRIVSQLAAVQHAVHFTGTLSQFLNHVRDDPTQHLNSPAEVVPAFEVARARILTRLPTLFNALPKARYEIRALPESARNSQDNGYFAPAAADGSRPGILWINTYASGVRDKFNVMTISLHEGLPGHHLQTALAQETDLPAFRRFDSTTAYGEGWGLYAESLGQEMGFYTDPWNDYGHLNYAMLRASRLVVDTGIHAMGWSVADGVRWMTDHSSMSAEQATAEVERYVAAPGQALAYKIGELEIRRLRERAQRMLGTKFDIKAFHDQVLLGGSMPLTVLEQRVQSWLEH